MRYGLRVEKNSNAEGVVRLTAGVGGSAQIFARSCADLASLRVSVVTTEAPACHVNLISTSLLPETQRVMSYA